MKTSEAGIEFLERHEGVVLKAYRDPVGILTIGAGLTKASGVVDPRPGMVITQGEATRLLSRALRANYEPRVRAAMPAANQHEFDGAVSFDWNTGAIHRASWVKAWHARDWSGVQSRLALWKKGGGRVLPGLVRRRFEEFRVIRHGTYGARPQKDASLKQVSHIALDLNGSEIAALIRAFKRLGYDPVLPGLDGIARSAVLAFQRDHDLIIDGIIGRATLSTVQRMIDARKVVKDTAQSGGVVATGSGGASAIGVLDASSLWLIGGGIVLVFLLVAAFYGWRYRDAVAAKVQKRFPKLAKNLRGY